MDEYEVKAGFVASFASYIDWPPDSFQNAGDPFNICVLGDNPFGSSLESIAAGKRVHGRALAVRQISGAHQAAGCHILYVSPSEHLRLRGILLKLQSQSVFSVGDTNDFIAEGGLANLRLESGRVRIEINADAAKQRRLRISSRLLQLAKDVKR